MQKRILSLLLALVLVFGLLPVTASANELDNGLQYEVYDDSVSIIGYSGLATEVIIPDQIEGLPVTSISGYAFLDCSNVTRIVLPESISTIGVQAFSNCTRLSEISIPERVTWIDSEAFFGCSSLTSIFIPARVMIINLGAFANCSSLTKITVDENNSHYSSNNQGFLFNKDKTHLIQAPGAIKNTYQVPDGVIGISEMAFYNCSKLTGITLPDTVTSIHDQAFYNCSNLASITFSDTLTSIYEQAFYNCSKLTNITFPDTVTFIGKQAFYGCESLSNVNFNDNIKHIEAEAFYGCTSLTNISIPKGVDRISSQAFYGCESLSNVNFHDSLRYIEPEAFYGCSSLTTIFIPAKVESISYTAFDNCANLTGFIVDENNPVYSSDDRGVLFFEKRYLTQAPRKLAGSYDIPNGVTSIEEEAFCDCSNLTSISIPNTVTVIRDDAFHGCSRLTSVLIPDSVTSIGSNVFSECNSLTGIYVDENNQKYSSDDRGILYDKKKTYIVHVPYNFCGYYTPPSTLNRYGNIFQVHPYLTGITIPSDDYTTNEDAFADCSSLSTVHYAGKCNSIYPNAYRNVTATIYYYRTYSNSWDPSMFKDYGGDLTWVEYDKNHTHEYTSFITNPSCTSQGCTTIICTKCGIGHSEEYVDALGHDYVDGFCTRCYEDDPNYETPVENPFTDVPAGCWYEAPVMWALENGVTSGSSETTFSPGDKCLRAHVVTFLWNAEKCPEPAAAASTFTDVPTGAWYEKPVLWAVENGITSGTSATKFGAGDVCSRYQVVFFLWKAAGSPEPKTTVNPFTDVNPGHFFYKAVLWAVENGITSGTSATTFGPTVPCNRAQVVTFLYAAYN